MLSNLIGYVIVALVGYLVGGTLGWLLFNGWEPACWIGMAFALGVAVFGESFAAGAADMGFESFDD